MKKPGKHGGRIIIRNLPFGINQKQLKKIASKIGKIKEISLPWLQEKQRNRGFAFIEFEKKNVSEKALKVFNTEKIQGRSVSADWAFAKKVYDQVVQSSIPPNQQEIQQTTEAPESSQEQKNFKPKNDKFQQGKTIFLTNVSYDTTDQSLIDCFKAYGKIQYVNLVKNSDTGIPRGTAFVCFKHKKSLQKLLKKTQENNLELDGRILNIKEAKKKQEIQKIKPTVKKEQDKRNLHLAKQGLVLPDSQEFSNLTKDQIIKRTLSAKQKKTKLKNPNVFISKTRISIKNLPKNTDEKTLKRICRKILENQNPQLTTKKLFKQVKIQRDKNRSGKNGLALSRGFGFVQCIEHQHALQLVRKLNNNSQWFGGKKPIVQFSLEDHRVLRIRRIKSERLDKLKQKKEKSQEPKLGRGKKQRLKRRMEKTRLENSKDL